MKMLENNNKKNIKTLSDSCLKANKGRNTIAIFAITLTAILFMSLTTAFEGSSINIRNQLLRQSGTKFMVSIKNLTKEEAQQIVSYPEFTKAGVERYVSNVLNPELNYMTAIAGWADESAAQNSFMTLEEGHYPQKIDEIACDSEVLMLLGLPYKTGSSFKLQYTAGEKILERQMTVCGIWKGMRHEQQSSLLVSESFVDEAVSFMDGVYAVYRNRNYDVRGSFASEKNISETLDKIVERAGYDPDAERNEDGFLIHHINPVYGTQSMDSAQEFLQACIAALLILLAGYLIIYNIFKISVEKDIRLYGQLKTIGLSPRQIRYMIIRQGTLLSFISIPIGLILGLFIGNGLLWWLFMSNSSFTETSFIVPPVWIWLLSALFTWFTVRISCSRPGRIAGQISPIEALKYNTAAKSKKTHQRGKASRHRIASMALSNLSRNKIKTAIVVTSLSLSAVLLNCVQNYVQNMDEQTYVKHQTIADFDVRNAAYLKTSSEDFQKIVPEDAAQTLKNLDGVVDFGQVYCNMLPDDELTEQQEDLAKVISINGIETPSDIIKFDRNRMIYGYDENALSKLKIIEGSIDYEKLCSGSYVVITGFLSDRDEYYYETSEFHAGDTIEAEINGTIQKYTVMAVAGTAISLNMSYSKGGYESLAFAEPLFLKMFPQMKGPIHCLFNAQDGKFDDVNQAVDLTAQRNGLSVLSRLSAEEEFMQMKTTYGLAGTTVSLIIGTIGLLNLINVILTGVIARRMEFASMRSIGMTKKQLLKLIIYEGLMYAALAGIIGLAVSSILSVTLVKDLSADLWYMKYHFTLLPAAAASIFCIISAAVICAVTDRFWNQGSVVEQLRSAD